MRIPIFSVIAFLTGLCFLTAVVKADSDASGNLDLLILHNNDMHSRFEETSRSAHGDCKHKTNKNGGSRGISGCVGGFARTAYEVKRYRKLANDGTLGRQVLYLNAGDCYTGTTWFTVHRWKICADFMALLHPETMCLGNHEFDDGISSLVKFIDTVRFPIIAANLNLTLEPSLEHRLNKSVVFEVSGRKIGIVGHVTTDTKTSSSSEEVIFDDEISSVRAETEALDQAGVKIIIILGHSGFTLDKKLAKEVPLADVVVGGHTNTFQWNGPQPDIEKIESSYPAVITQSSGKRVPVVQAYAYTKYLGRLNVTFDSNGDLIDFFGQPLLMDTHIPQDQDTLDLLESYRPEIEALKSKTIGKSRVTLDTSDRKCRIGECNFGNLIADAFVYYTATLSVGKGWNDAPIGLISGGAIRSTIEPDEDGSVSEYDLLQALPYNTSVVTLKLKGSDLIGTLEIGVRDKKYSNYGKYLQVSGLRVVYNMNRPFLSRVVSVDVRCGQCRVPIYEPIDENKIYSVTTTTFLTDGGDGHHILQKNGFDMKIQDEKDLKIVEFYINRTGPVYPEEQGRITIVPVYPEQQGRITIIRSSTTSDRSILASGATTNAPLLLLCGSVLYFALSIWYYLRLSNVIFLGNGILHTEAGDTSLQRRAR